MPNNDDRRFPTSISNRDSTAVGLRLAASKTPTGPDVSPDNLTLSMMNPPNDLNDPPLLQPTGTSGGLVTSASNCPDRDSVKSSPNRPDLFYARRTVWYQIKQDMSGSLFNQRRLVTIDTGGSNFGASLQVFRDSIPTFVPTRTPVLLPTNVVACDSPVGTGVPAVVSFVTEPGKRYFIEAGVGPQARVPSSPANAALFLSTRILDIAPPGVTVRALDSTQDAGNVFSYELSTDDPKHVGVPSVSVAQIRAGRALPALHPLFRGRQSTGCGAEKVRPHPGFFCITPGDKPLVFVRWRSISPTSDSGRVTASFTDQAGNVGKNAIQTLLRDTKPPKILGTPHVKWNRRGRLSVSARCIRGPGSIQVEVTSGGPPRKAGLTRFGRRTMVLKRTYNSVRRRSLFVHITCFDRSKNSNDRWLFLPR